MNPGNNEQIIGKQMAIRFKIHCIIYLDSFYFGLKPFDSIARSLVSSNIYYVNSNICLPKNSPLFGNVYCLPSKIERGVGFSVIDIESLTYEFENKKEKIKAIVQIRNVETFLNTGELFLIEYNYKNIGRNINVRMLFSDINDGVKSEEELKREKELGYSCIVNTIFTPKITNNEILMFLCPIDMITGDSLDESYIVVEELVHREKIAIKSSDFNVYAGWD